VAVAFAFGPASFVSYAVKEEQDKVKHQQLISGVSAASYWSANYIWDLLNFLVVGVACIVVLHLYQVDQLIGENAVGVALAILLFGLAVIPFNYLCSFLFKNHTTAQNMMLLFYILTGSLLLIVTWVMQQLPATAPIISGLQYIFRLIPSYAFGECMLEITLRNSTTANNGKQKDIFDMEVGQEQERHTLASLATGTAREIPSHPLPPSHSSASFCSVCFLPQLDVLCCIWVWRSSCTSV
jgi:ATP-binding cassette subfamily A (ABC1) protein 3